MKDFSEITKKQPAISKTRLKSSMTVHAYNSSSNHYGSTR